jgi:ABC-2 type transport system permease protein
VLFGKFAWFKAYLLVPAMAMLATSIGLAVTLLSFRTIGPRRTRIVVQVLAVIIGVGMMLAVYLPGMIRRGSRGGPLTTTIDTIRSQGGDHWFWLVKPAEWVTQGYLPTVLFLLVCAGLIALTVHLTGERIVHTLTAITSGAVRKSRAAAGATGFRFRSGFRGVVIRKELKLLLRDPFIVAQVLQQSLFALPIAFVLWRTPLGGTLPIAWLAAIVLAASLAGPLAWLTIVAEDAPDLLASAPVSRAALVRAKIEAAVLPTLPICAAPFIVLISTRPWFGFCVALCALGASLSGALLNMRNPVARKRDSFRTRHKGSPWRGLLEMLSLAVWIGVCLLLAWLGS